MQLQIFFCVVVWYLLCVYTDLQYTRKHLLLLDLSNDLVSQIYHYSTPLTLCILPVPSEASILVGPRCTYPYIFLKRKTGFLPPDIKMQTNPHKLLYFSAQFTGDWICQTVDAIWDFSGSSISQCSCEIP